MGLSKLARADRVIKITKSGCTGCQEMTWISSVCTKKEQRSVQWLLFKWQFSYLDEVMDETYGVAVQFDEDEEVSFGRLFCICFTTIRKLYCKERGLGTNKSI